VEALFTTLVTELNATRDVLRREGMTVTKSV
jgi:hypothetical protein